MATYNSTQHSLNPNAFPGPGLGLVMYQWSVTSTAAFANLDVINFGKVPKGFRPILTVLESTDIDTNGAPTATIDVGDSGSSTRIIAASTVGQAGTLSSVISTAIHGFIYTDDTLIVGGIPTGPATGAIGTVTLSMIGRVDGAAS